MRIKCMLTILLFTCSAVILLIILTNLNTNEQTLPYAASEKFVKKYTAIDNENLLFKNKSIKILDLEIFQYIIDTMCNYSYTDYEDLRDNKKLKIVWIITSYAGDVTKRSALRHAYTSKELRRFGIRRVFLLGTLDEQTQKKTGITQFAIENEAEKFQDILQGNFIEAYKNLTYKHLMGLQWAVNKCSNGYSYIMKMDDDIIINLYETMILLQNTTNLNTSRDFLMGHVLEHMRPIRNRANKWYVTNEEFSKEFYPSFLSGWFYMTNMLTAFKLIYQSKQFSKYFWIDDLFITGILREEAGIENLVNIKEFFASDYRFLKCCLKTQKISNYKCDYIVGPDGGDINLLFNFKKLSAYCYYQQKCFFRPKKQLLKDTCILYYKNNDLGTGNAQIEKLSYRN